MLWSHAKVEAWDPVITELDCPPLSGRVYCFQEAQGMKVEIDREDDGRWIAEVAELPGVMAYGGTREEAIAKVKALALRVMADRLEHGEDIPDLKEVFAVAT
jgi:predicted RNase H-like HicB family nuclease